MSYEFFFSYTRANNGNYLQKLFKDLSEEVREQKGLPVGSEVGFFDQREIELGEQWEATIVEALQKSKVLVCIYSPAYFNSEYCGKEWQVFQMRREKYVTDRQNGAQLKENLPPVIKPVLWITPLPYELDPAIGASQFTEGDPHSICNTEGLKYVLSRTKKVL